MISLSITSSGNSESFLIRGDVSGGEYDPSTSFDSSGDRLTLVCDGETGTDELNSDGGTISIVGVTEDGAETTVKSADYGFGCS